jgi:hypothetical protein
LTSSLVAWSNSNASFIEAWGENIVPLFSHEWMGSRRLKHSQKHGHNNEMA